MAFFSLLHADWFRENAKSNDWRLNERDKRVS
jgi:hypothetical protein